jgi:hypothetical protein
MNSKQTITVFVTEKKSVQRFPEVITVILNSQRNEYIHQSSELNYCNKNLSNNASSSLTWLTHLLGMHQYGQFFCVLSVHPVTQIVCYHTRIFLLSDSSQTQLQRFANPVILYSYLLKQTKIYIWHARRNANRCSWNRVVETVRPTRKLKYFDNSFIEIIQYQVLRKFVQLVSRCDTRI